MHDFTLVIPTHNRHKYLSRSIEYFKRLDASIIYCDSSEVAYSGKIEANMRYLHLPNKKFADKILIALDEIDTGFIALCADDDFIILESLYKGFKILKKSSSFNTVLGTEIFFNENFDGYFYKSDVSIPNEIYLTPAENALSFFSNYQQVLWGMYSKNLIYDSLEVIKKSGFSNDNFIELTIGALACYRGGIKVLDDIWSVRELNVNEHWGEGHTPISNIYQDKQIRKDFNRFKYYIDNLTYVGYADLVITSYIKLSTTEKLKKNLKNFLKWVVPEFILLRIKPSHKNNTASNSQKELKILENQYVLDSDSLTQIIIRLST